MKYKLGIACSNTYTMKNPYLYTATIEADTYEEARDKFLEDVFVKKDKLNDIVMVLAIGT